ncbi:rCG41877 [Rattus norvegicus]|uniref:RCG41877 n=1 Tax=Rattus norvegicus TaxID=10116 RepID=A6KKP0_RAT|nr:rCG41877 [Rattus norvegicus]
MVTSSPALLCVLELASCRFLFLGPPGHFFLKFIQLTFRGDLPI